MASIAELVYLVMKSKKLLFGYTIAVLTATAAVLHLESGLMWHHYPLAKAELLAD